MRDAGYGRRVTVSAVDLPGVRRLLEQGAQLVEVLPAAEYDEQHLPGAVNLPLEQLDGDSARDVLQDERP